MKNYTDIFFEIPCLTECSQQFSGLYLQKKWFKSVDKRVIGQYLYKFSSYNAKQFEFLGVKPIISGVDQKINLAFKSSQYIGVIPLRAPDTGKQIGDFAVMPRFIGHDRFEDYIDILNLLDQSIETEIMDSLPLISGRNFRPPFYLEAIKFIETLEQLFLKSWRKFDTHEKLLQQPTGRVNWNKYVQGSSKVENQLMFPTKVNVLTELHKEYAEIKYVFDICKKELMSMHVPDRIRYSFRKRVRFLEEKMYLHQAQFTKQIIIKAKDSLTIKTCKIQANKVLNYSLSTSLAWRVDFADVFEKFTQYIFKQMAKETGGKVFSNTRFYAKSSKNYAWELKYLEPDAIYKKNQSVIFIDAKYKSHIYNKFTHSESLKDEYRHDLHQIMAYSSFNQAAEKYGILCYPSFKLDFKKRTYINSINGAENTILILELPLKSSIVEEAKKLLIRELSQII